MNPELLAALEALASQYKTNIVGNVVAFAGDVPEAFAVGDADDAANKPLPPVEAPAAEEAAPVEAAPVE